VRRRPSPVPERPREHTRPRTTAGRSDRNRKRTDLLVPLRNVLLLLLVAQCLRVAFTSPRLRLREIRVTGSSRLSVAQVRELGNIQLGENVFRVNLAQVSRRMLTEPYLRDAIVTRELPDAINVRLEERTPALQIACNGAIFDADPDGVVFQRARQVAADQPLLEIPARELPPLGGKLLEKHLALIRECSDLAKQHRLAVHKLHIDEGEELWLNVATSGTPSSDSGTSAPADNPGPKELSVRLGRATELPEKFRDIQKALAGWPDLLSSANYLNVMCPGRPALRLANAEPASTTATN
jgi:hypothetical protein